MADQLIKPVESTHHHAAVEPGEIHFDPPRLISAIVYHVTDDADPRALCSASVRATLQRLQENATTLTIPRSEWADLTDAQRLHRLMCVTSTELSRSLDGQLTLRQSTFRG